MIGTKCGRMFAICYIVGIFFQDDRMATFFEYFPELILFDGSYKLNNRDMPLITQLSVDGNGETQIVSIFVCISESRQSIGSMIDAKLLVNASWRKTKVILGDKDFADRSIYKEKFPDAELQICLWHVLVALKREVTTTKRDITKFQRELALEILEKLVYCRSAESYDKLYQELLDLNLEKVTDYYNDNWHNIRDEWTHYGRNQHSNYLNSTNNRSESLNQKYKMVSSRHANLSTFFENVFTTVTVVSSERDIRTVRMTMKTTRTMVSDPYLAQ